MTADLIILKERIPEGRTVEEAITRAKGRLRSLYHRYPNDEERRLTELVAYTTGLYGGDELAGTLLASVAVYE